MCVCISGGWRLFSVRGEVAVEAFLLEVECCSASLRSRGCLLLLGVHQRQLYLWHGCKAQPTAHEVGKRTVERLTHTWVIIRYLLTHKHQGISVTFICLYIRFWMILSLCVCACACCSCPPELGFNSNTNLKVQEIEEGREPQEFWDALGQQDRKAYDCMLQGTVISN